MKLKPALATLLIPLLTAAAAHAGPQVYFSFGANACAPRPVYCPPQPVYFPRAYCAPTVTYVTYGNNLGYFGPTVYSNQQVVTYGAPVYRVPAPVFTTQPVQVFDQNTFRWRR